jgi:xanthine dehydrogenase accessory factor
MVAYACYQQLFALLAQGPVIVATVIAAQGETPRGIGAKMLIWGTAETYDSLGDPASDARVMAQALEVLKTGMPQRLTLDIAPSAPKGIGGTLQLWLSRWQGTDAIATVQQVLTTLETPSSEGRLVIPLVAGQTPYVLSQENSSLRNLQGKDAYIEDLV